MRYVTVTENPRHLEAVTADPFICGLEAVASRDRLAAGRHELGQPRHALVDLPEPAVG
jgi:hypothetical protein